MMGRKEREGKRSCTKKQDEKRKERERKEKETREKARQTAGEFSVWCLAALERERIYFSKQRAVS